MATIDEAADELLAHVATLDVEELGTWTCDLPAYEGARPRWARVVCGEEG